MTGIPRAADNVLRSLLRDAPAAVDTDNLARRLLAALGSSWVEALDRDHALLYDGTLLRFTGDGDHPSGRLRMAALLGFHVTVSSLPIPTSRADEPSIETALGGRVWMTQVDGGPALRPGPGEVYLDASGIKIVGAVPGGGASGIAA